MTRKKNSETNPVSPTAQVEIRSQVKDKLADAAAVATPVASTPFPIVGIGASAGGLAAFEAFFSGLPSDVDPGMAFILVQHRAPEHKSLLSELIQNYTHLQVFDVEEGMRVQVNCVYIIPPGYDLALLNGSLHLMDPVTPRGQHHPVDFLFQSLAQDQREMAIGIVLSGTASDGTLGVRAIKGAGGMVMAQSTASSEFDGMPQSAIATGMVDYQLAPAEMVPRLMAYISLAFAKDGSPTAPSTPRVENLLKKIFVLLRGRTGHDFSQYKPSTINRRIERRMAVHQIETIEDYVKYLQQTAEEVDALFRDLLIGVTSFFRDPRAFQVLENKIIPQLFEGKPAGGTIRVWSAGCSTGEEAYSLAILMLEYAETLKQNHKVQVFATDIDSYAITTARNGLYPASIAADISPERLSRFFSLEPGGLYYRVGKNIRDLLVFSEQDLIKDPPFSRLDLISCRNVLIYLNKELQKMLIPIFHYALLPNAKLFLGSSEGVGEFDTLFNSVDRKAKIYQRSEDLLGVKRGLPYRAMPNQRLMDDVLPGPVAHKPGYQQTPPLKEITEQALLKLIAPASVLVTASGDIVYLHGRTGMYLEPTAGEAGVQNIFKMAREGLRPSLTKLLNQTVASKLGASTPHLRVKTNGHFTLVNLSVHPVPTRGLSDPDSSLYLVVFEDEPVTSEKPDSPEAHVTTPTGDAKGVIDTLTQELRAKDEYLQSTLEELESANEELKSSNEEMQSVNEELQSTNEELETSKEELQSVNEELSTVNNELHIKINDLSRANNDLNNLLAGTGVGTIFVDFQYRILRFTPDVSGIINLIATDVGRPVTHFVSNLEGYTSLKDDLKSVLDTLMPKEVEVQTLEDQWYTMRIQPYRTLENVIEGAVITFTDITQRKQAEISLSQVSDQLRLATIVNDSFDAIILQDKSGQIMAWNPAAERLYGWSQVEALQMNNSERIPESLRDREMAFLASLNGTEEMQPFLTRRLTSSGNLLDVSIITSAMLDESGNVYAVSSIERIVPGLT